mmetsp:Transcript_1259/g.4943  ORF Transcript_1259/g.4943 Transcript_1259/m.4943 type:complete len:269 (-) Transcript_1259:729-1535(-)
MPTSKPRWPRWSRGCSRCAPRWAACPSSGARAGAPRRWSRNSWRSSFAITSTRAGPCSPTTPGWDPGWEVERSDRSCASSSATSTSPRRCNTPGPTPRSSTTSSTCASTAWTSPRAAAPWTPPPGRSRTTWRITTRSGAPTTTRSFRRLPRRWRASWRRTRRRSRRLTRRRRSVTRPPTRTWRRTRRSWSAPSPACPSCRSARSSSTSTPTSPPLSWATSRTAAWTSTSRSRRTYWRVRGTRRRLWGCCRRRAEAPPRTSFVWRSSTR